MGLRDYVFWAGQAAKLEFAANPAAVRAKYAAYVRRSSRDPSRVLDVDSLEDWIEAGMPPT